VIPEERTAIAVPPG